MRVFPEKASLDTAKIVHQDQALRQAAGQAFYNTSNFTLRDLKAIAGQQQLKADFEAYLDGFSPNVQDILGNFEFRNQIPRLSKADALGTLIEKLLSPNINVSPNPVLNGDGSVKYPGLDNHGMGTVFEELIRRFNEEYLNTVLNDVSVLSTVRREAIPSLHQSNLNPTRYGRLHVSLPPLDEQQEILQGLKSKTSDLEEVIAAARREISLLREYRTRLIADVVTGKRDVREAAAHLPDVGANNHSPSHLLFDKDTDTIGRHLSNIFKEGELEESATTEESSVVQVECNRQFRRKVRFFNLDAIISVGYRVNSKRGTQFRIWATTVLRDHTHLLCDGGSA